MTYKYLKLHRQLLTIFVLGVQESLEGYVGLTPMDVALVVAGTIDGSKT